MLPLILAATVALATPCPSDPLLTNPRLKVVRARDKTLDNYVVTLDVTNRGAAAQAPGIVQRLELLQNRQVIGTQPIPPLAAHETYPAAFRLQLAHKKKHPPLVVAFRYVPSGAGASRGNCDAANDTLNATLH